MRQNHLGIGSSWVLCFNAYLVPQLSERDIQRSGVPEIVVDDTCALDLAGT